MTRKHFIAIADSIGLNLRNEENKSGRSAIWQVAYDLCPTFSAVNSNSDKDRFVDHIAAVAAGTKGITS